MPDIALNHIALLQSFSYFGVFVAVALAGHFVPVPEDISLIAAGYIVALGFAKLWPMILVGITAPIFADGLLFYLARAGSRFAPPPDKFIKGRVLEFAQRQMLKNTFRTVFIMRFITGFRFLSPLLAAYLGMPYKKYLAANTISAMAFGPFFIMLGYVFHTEITAIIEALTTIEHGILIALGAGLVLLTLYYTYKRYNIRNAKE